MRTWPFLALGLSLAACSTQRSTAVGRPPAAEVYRSRAVQALDVAEHGAEHHHGAGAQAVNLFLGGSREDGERNGLTFGLDYEYRIFDEVGVGAFAEGITGLHRAFATGGQVYWHAWRELVLTGGVGAELKDHHTGEGATWAPIFRLGASYEIPLSDDGWMVAPSFSYDFTEEENVVLFGVNLGYVF